MCGRYLPMRASRADWMLENNTTAAIATGGILKLVEMILPIRVSESEETAGLDLSQHGEIAYAAA